MWDGPGLLYRLLEFGIKRGPGDEGVVFSQREVSTS